MNKNSTIGVCILQGYISFTDTEGQTCKEIITNLGKDETDGKIPELFYFQLPGLGSIDTISIVRDDLCRETVWFVITLFTCSFCFTTVY